ncbi:Histidine biosynthesis [Gracilaria domingensis]|nr:Histidine biosynthesis [Gracilaria domingensis]
MERKAGFVGFLPIRRKNSSGVRSMPSRAVSVRRTEITMRTMRFRPCIDIHQNRVKQIVGGTLTQSEMPETNFETDMSPAYFASMYRDDRLPGGHVIMLGPGNEETACQALQAFPGGMHVGGGIQPSTCARFLEAGASHVIVTSYVFREGTIVWERVDEMIRTVGKNRLVLDVSCRKRDGEYFVCTDRWQKWTDFKLNARNFERLGNRCDEILVHAVDLEGKRSGIDLELIRLLASWATVPVTYAGGVQTMTDLELAKSEGCSLVDVTIGSALDIFGGQLKYKDAVRWQRLQEKTCV